MKRLTIFISVLAILVVMPGAISIQVPSLDELEATDTWAGNDPVSMTIHVTGNPVTGWTIEVSGNVGADAPSGVLTLLVIEGVISPMDLSWMRGEALVAGQSFAETFHASSTPSGATLLARFFYDGQWYTLMKQYRIVLPALGERTIELVPIVISGGHPDQVLPEASDSMPPANMFDRPAPSQGDVGAQATTTISGTLRFIGSDTANYLCRLCYIDVYDKDTLDADDYLGWTTTTFSGAFSVTVDNTDCVFCSGVDPYFVAWTYTGAGYVIDNSGNTYSHQTPELFSNCANTSCSLGTVTMSTAGDPAKGFLAYYALALGWQEVRWNGPGADIGAARLRVPASVGGSAISVFYTDAEIQIPSDEVNVDAISHEHGHYAMLKRLNPDGTNDLWFPESMCSTGVHYMTGESDLNCAYAEGWAHYFALETQDDPTFQYPGGSSFNLEARPCASGCGWGSGDDGEGRVASTFWDIVDSPVDSGSSPSETTDRSLTQLWPALADSNNPPLSAPGTFAGYYQSWTNRGNSATEFRNAANWNTIPYT